MGLFTLLTTAFLVGLTGAMMPGPMLTITLDRTARYGWTAGPLVVLGHGILELILVVGLVFGLGSLLTAELFTSLIGTVGGAVLVWFGVDIVKSAGKVDIPGATRDPSRANPETQRFSRVSPIFSGISTSISNPYWLLWWGTVGAGFVAMAMQTQGLAGLLVFFSGHITADLVWFSAVAFALDRGGHLMPKKLFTNLLRVLGFFLVGTALYFIYSGVNILLSL